MRTVNFGTVNFAKLAIAGFAAGAFAATAGAATAGLAFPAATSVTAADGVALAASWGVPNKATRGVVLVHQSGRNKEDFSSLGAALARDGNAVIAVDLRGHGGNVPAGATAPELAPADYAAMIGDVRAAAQALAGKGVKTFSFVGAELGANLVLNAAVDDPAVASVVLLSPGLDYKGIIASDATYRYGKRSLLLVASDDDTYGSKSAGLLAGRAQGPHEYRLLEGAGKGIKMFNREAALEGYVVGWIGSHWVLPQEAAPAPSGTIDVKATPVSVTPTK